jgi:hypothetical protein
MKQDVALIDVKLKFPRCPTENWPEFKLYVQ